MSDIDKADVIHTRIWREESEADNPFATRAAYCRGYDVFGQLVGKARWIEMLVLLMRDELPSDAALDALEALAVALANPGPRDPSIHAAMCGGVGGSTAAASLIAALSVGAGRSGGAREVHDAMLMWQNCGRDLEAWLNHAGGAVSAPVEVWPDREHLPGFDPHGASVPTTVRQLLSTLAQIGKGPNTSWLLAEMDQFHARAGMPLAMTGVAACLFSDLGFSAAEGEMLFLLLRLPGAAAHALEQQGHGYRRFPFYPIELDPSATPKEPA
jgi:citrate synthase